MSLSKGILKFKTRNWLSGYVSPSVLVFGTFIVIALLLNAFSQPAEVEPSETDIETQELSVDSKGKVLGDETVSYPVEDTPVSSAVSDNNL